jgi:hypothetical protein
MSTDPTTVDVNVTKTDTGWAADVSGVAGTITATSLEELQADVTTALAALFPDHGQPPAPIFRFPGNDFRLDGMTGGGKSNALHLVMAEARMTGGGPSPATLAALLQGGRKHGF